MCKMDYPIIGGSFKNETKCMKHLAPCLAHILNSQIIKILILIQSLPGKSSQGQRFPFRASCSARPVTTMDTVWESRKWFHLKVLPKSQTS